MFGGLECSEFEVPMRLAGECQKAGWVCRSGPQRRGLWLGSMDSW